jgi:tRNA 5-methylaminomethyl-2-thiouridine biosynthesis bifunctional protein
MYDMPQSPYSEIFDDIYFSPEDGPAETRYVFLDGNNLPENFKDKNIFTIGETGFGTGLNFLMAWQAFGKQREDGQKLHFISFEKYPLNKEDIQNAMGEFFPNEMINAFLAAYPEEYSGVYEADIHDYIRLTLIFGDINDEIQKLEEKVDAWFLDGFAPAKNPDMWTETVFRNMARLSHEETTVATFTAAGHVRRGLARVGFDVEKTKGFGRKRDMTKGVYRGS